jgi:hypothetical protein
MLLNFEKLLNKSRKKVFRGYAFAGKARRGGFNNNTFGHA